MGVSLLYLGFRQHQLLDVEHIGLCGGEAYPTVQQIDNFVIYLILIFLLNLMYL